MASADATPLEPRQRVPGGPTGGVSVLLHAGDEPDRASSSRPSAHVAYPSGDAVVVTEIRAGIASPSPHVFRPSGDRTRPVTFASWAPGDAHRGLLAVGTRDEIRLYAPPADDSPPSSPAGDDPASSSITETISSTPRTTPRDGSSSTALRSTRRVTCAAWTHDAEGARLATASGFVGDARRRPEDGRPGDDIPGDDIASRRRPSPIAMVVARPRERTPGARRRGTHPRRRARSPPRSARPSPLRRVASRSSGTTSIPARWRRTPKRAAPNTSSTPPRSWLYRGARRLSGEMAPHPEEAALMTHRRRRGRRWTRPPRDSPPTRADRARARPRVRRAGGRANERGGSPRGVRRAVGAGGARGEGAGPRWTSHGRRAPARSRSRGRRGDGTARVVDRGWRPGSARARARTRGEPRRFGLSRGARLSVETRAAFAARAPDVGVWPTARRREGREGRGSRGSFGRDSNRRRVPGRRPRRRRTPRRRRRGRWRRGRWRAGTTETGTGFPGTFPGTLGFGDTARRSSPRRRPRTGTASPPSTRPARRSSGVGATAFDFRRTRSTRAGSALGAGPRGAETRSSSPPRDGARVVGESEEMFELVGGAGRSRAPPTGIVTTSLVDSRREEDEKEKDEDVVERDDGRRSAEDSRAFAAAATLEDGRVAVYASSRATLPSLPDGPSLSSDGPSPSPDGPAGVVGPPAERGGVVAFLHGDDPRAVSLWVLDRSFAWIRIGALRVDAPATATTLSPDASKIAVASVDGSVTVWSAEGDVRGGGRGTPRQTRPRAGSERRARRRDARRAYRGAISARGLSSVSRRLRDERRRVRRASRAVARRRANHRSSTSPSGAITWTPERRQRRRSASDRTGRPRTPRRTETTAERFLLGRAREPTFEPRRVGRVGACAAPPEYHPDALVDWLVRREDHAQESGARRALAYLRDATGTRTTEEETGPVPVAPAELLEGEAGEEGDERGRTGREDECQREGEHRGEGVDGVERACEPVNAASRGPTPDFDPSAFGFGGPAPAPAPAAAPTRSPRVRRRRVRWVRGFRRRRASNGARAASPSART